MLDKKINEVIINIKKNKINKDMAIMKLDNLLKNEIPKLEKGKKRQYKNKIYKVKKIL